MIQLRSAIEELGRLIVDPEAGPPAWAASEAVREAVDGAARQELLDWGPSPGRKALLLGASWPRLAADLAEREMFVTVVEPDAALARAVSDDAGRRGLLSQITVSQGDAKDRTFEPSGFNLVVAWESLERYEPVDAMLKKLVRELKTGGKLFVRGRVAAPAGPDVEAVIRRSLPIALSMIAPAASKTIGRPSYLGARTRGASAEALLEQLARLFVVEKSHREHVLVPDLADLAATVAPGLVAALPYAVRADNVLLGKHPELARTLTVFAKKERELGSLFRV